MISLFKRNSYARSNAVLLSDGLLSSFIFLILVVNSVYLWIQHAYPLDYGFEYAQIASSIVDGKGFSNPFAPCETGPTAWMPPFLVFVNAFCFFLFKKGMLAFIVVNLIQSGCISLGFYFVLRALRYQHLGRITRLLFFVIFIVFLIIHRFFLAFKNYDLGIYTLAIGIAVLLLSQLLFDNKIHPLFYLYLFLVPLSTPALLSPLLLVLFFLFLKASFPQIKKNILFFTTRQFWVSARIYIFAVLSVFSAMAIWSFRNYMTFHEVVPLKSNMWFEFYLANIVSPDGMNYNSLSTIAHPYQDLAICQSIVASGGEIKWLRQFKGISKAYLENNKRDYLAKVEKRMFNALVWTQFPFDVKESAALENLSMQDKEKLEEHNIIKKASWTSLTLNETNVSGVLSETDPLLSDRLLNDWKAKRHEFYADNYSLKGLIRGALLAGIPFLCLLIMLFFDRRNTFIQCIFIFFVSYLATYILISHVMRQQSMLIVLNALIISLFVNWLTQLRRLSPEAVRS